jgi:HSP20 family protein
MKKREVHQAGVMTRIQLNPAFPQGGLGRAYMAPKSATTSGSPLLQLWETETEYLLRMLIPGADQESLTIEAGPQSLSINGAVNLPSPGEATLRYREFFNQSFSRSVQFAEQIDTEAVLANYTDGILTVTLPKSNTSRVVKVQLQK